MSELFLSIFNTAITAGWLVLAVLAARLLLKKAPAWVKCALWAIVALRLVWPFEIESLISLIPSSQTVPPAQLYSPMPQIDTGISVVNAVINPVFIQTFAPEPSNSVNPLQVGTIVAAWVWVAGMAGMAIYAVISYLRLRRRVRVRMPVEKDVYLSDGVDTPFILGVLRPKIYLPSDLSREKWDNILAHERAHLARKDHWWKPLGFLLLTVFWFHPLLWLGYILLCRDVERACDEKVIKNLSSEDKKTYSEVLLECSVPRKWISACPLAFGETGVKGRIKAVLHYKKPTLWIIVAALIVGSILAVCFLTEPVGDFSGNDSVYQLEYLDSTFLTSYMPDSGDLCIISVNQVLQYMDMNDSSNAGVWEHVGKLESVRLSKKELRMLFDGFRYSDVEEIKEIYKNNRKIWRLACMGRFEEWEIYIFQQKNGQLYCLAGPHLFRLTQTQMTIDVAGKAFIYEKEGAGGPFTITLDGDGSFNYYEGWFSSHIGMGNWEQKGGKLYLYEEGYTDSKRFVFVVEADALVYFAAESDAFIYVNVADGERFYLDQSVQQEKQHLMFVDVVDVQEDCFIGVDRQGTRWKIDTSALRNDIDFAKCWVVYYAKPNVLEEEAQYEVRAVRCWLYKEDIPKAGGRVYDTVSYDIDGDGVKEECILSENITGKISTCKLSVWDGDVCEYEVCFNELLVPDENSFGSIPTEDTEIPAPYPYANVYAFVLSDGNLMIVTPSRGIYISAGQRTTFQVKFMDGELTVA